MLIRAPMVDIWIPSKYGGGELDPTVFIQCVNGRDPMDQKLWCHGLASLFREIHPAA